MQTAHPAAPAGPAGRAGRTWSVLLLCAGLAGAGLGIVDAWEGHGRVKGHSARGREYGAASGNASSFPAAGAGSRAARNGAAVPAFEQATTLLTWAGWSRGREGVAASTREPATSVDLLATLCADSGRSLVP